MKQIMGIINVNDNSFYRGSRCSTPVEIRQKVEQMIGQQADILDFGACSTRPGSMPVSEECEWNGIKLALSVIKDELKKSDSACSRLFKRKGQRNALSIDTFRSSIVKRAYDFIGEFTVNDISAGEDDPEMLHAAAEYGLPFIAMHKRGTPATMQGMCDYDDVTEEVLDYFRAFAQRAEAAGVTEWILDPGFGFAKTAEQNYRLLNELGRFTEAGLSGCGEDSPRVLVGISRKSMIYRPLGITPEDSLTQTQVLHLAALERGASILRVHDVAETARTVSIYRMLHGQGFNGLSHGIGGNKDVIPGTGRTLRQ